MWMYIEDIVIGSVALNYKYTKHLKYSNCYWKYCIQVAACLLHDENSYALRCKS